MKSSLPEVLTVQSHFTDVSGRVSIRKPNRLGKLALRKGILMAEVATTLLHAWELDTCKTCTVKEYLPSYVLVRQATSPLYGLILYPCLHTSTRQS